MYPYGPQQNDSEFRLEDSPYSSYHCLRIDTDRIGFPFFSERHYKLHVRISLDILQKLVIVKFTDPKMLLWTKIGKLKCSAIFLKSIGGNVQSQLIAMLVECLLLSSLHSFIHSFIHAFMHLFIQLDGEFVLLAFDFLWSVLVQYQEKLKTKFSSKERWFRNISSWNKSQKFSSNLSNLDNLLSDMSQWYYPTELWMELVVATEVWCLLVAEKYGNYCTVLGHDWYLLCLQRRSF